MVPHVAAVAVRLEELDPRLVELLTPFRLERFRCGLRRPVRRREELPVLLSVSRPEHGVVLFELELERLSEEITNVILLSPRERAAHALRRRWQERAHHPEHLTQLAFWSPAGECDPPAWARHTREL